jgi:hypothetical protein
MRDARYMRLISWTLQSGSEQGLRTIQQKITGFGTGVSWI